MPTIPDLVDSGAIIRIEIALDVHEQPQRLLYGTPSFTTWLQQMIDGAAADGNHARPLSHMSAAEQLDELFHAFVSGAPLLHNRQFRTIRAEDNAVWELKTVDLRIFGWFMARDCFAAVFGNWADTIKDHDLYRGYRIAIRRLRRELGIDADLCVKGSNPHDVLSL